MLTVNQTERLFGRQLGWLHLSKLLEAGQILGQRERIFWKHIARPAVQSNQPLVHRTMKPMSHLSMVPKLSDFSDLRSRNLEKPDNTRQSLIRSSVKYATMILLSPTSWSSIWHSDFRRINDPLRCIQKPGVGIPNLVRLMQGDLTFWHALQRQCLRGLQLVQDDSQLSTSEVKHAPSTALLNWGSDTDRRRARVKAKVT